VTGLECDSHHWRESKKEKEMLRRKKKEERGRKYTRAEIRN